MLVLAAGWCQKLSSGRSGQGRPGRRSLPGPGPGQPGPAHMIEFSQLHHMIEFSQLHCVSFLLHFQGAGAARFPRIPPNLGWDRHIMVVGRRRTNNHKDFLLPGTSRLSFSSAASSAAIRPGQPQGLRTHLGFAWVRHHVIEFRQLHHMIEFSLLHWSGGMSEV